MLDMTDGPLLQGSLAGLNVPEQSQQLRDFLLAELGDLLRRYGCPAPIPADQHRDHLFNPRPAQGPSRTQMAVQSGPESPLALHHAVHQGHHGLLAPPGQLLRGHLDAPIKVDSGFHDFQDDFWPDAKLVD